VFPVVARIVYVTRWFKPYCFICAWIFILI